MTLLNRHGSHCGTHHIRRSRQEFVYIYVSFYFLQVRFTKKNISKLTYSYSTSVNYACSYQYSHNILNALTTNQFKKIMCFYILCRQVTVWGSPAKSSDRREFPWQGITQNKQSVIVAYFHKLIVGRPITLPVAAAAAASRLHTFFLLFM